MKANLSLTPAQCSELATEYMDAYSADEEDNPTLKAFAVKHGLQFRGSLLGQLLQKVSAGYDPQFPVQ